MKISSQQKKIITVSRTIMQKYKFCTGSLNFFIFYGDSPGTEYLKFKALGSKYFFNFIIVFLKSFFSIGLHSRYETSELKIKKKDYKKIIVSWAFEEDFKKNGTYYDRYFKINSRSNNKILWFLIYMSEKKPDKMDKNIIILFEKKSFIRFNLFKLLSYSFKLLFSSKNLSLKISSLASFAEIAANNLLNKVEISKLKTLLMPYEGQPFQKEIIDTVRKKNNDIKIIGYDHSAPPPLPLNLNYDFLSPDILLINGSNQLKFYSKYLKWPKKKLKFVPSIRFQNEDKKKFEKKIFLPYQIVDKKIILNEFNSLIKKNKIEYLGNFNIKNHPNSQNSNIHHELILELKNLIKKNYKKKSKKISKPSAFFIGQTTAVILALEMGLVSYHICFNPITDSYTNTLWKNIKVTQLSDYTFKYELSKRNAFVNLKKEKNLFKKYYDSKI